MSLCCHNVCNAIIKSWKFKMLKYRQYDMKENIIIDEQLFKPKLRFKQISTVFDMFSLSYIT